MTTFAMDIFAPKGWKVKFLGVNGDEYDRKDAEKHGLKVGSIYTVKSVDIGNWSSGVILEEVPDVEFNTVMFEDVDDMSIQPAPKVGPARLENWSYGISSDGWTPPELLCPVLAGKVYNHPRFEDGHAITTSSIRGRKGDSIFTRNTEYKLGVVDPKYEAAYPDAKNRLLKTLPEL